MTIAFVVHGLPVPKGRPRFRMINGHASTYTPKETTVYEDMVVRAYWGYCASHPDEDLSMMRGAPLRIDLRFYLPPPNGTSKRRREMMYEDEIKFTKRPDIDNLAKSVLDGLNGIAYDDDKQIVELHGRKYYGAMPRVEIEISTLE